MKKEQISALKKRIDIPEKVVIVPHKGPDGDAIGSTLALYHFLKQKKHEVQLIAPNDFPDFLKWMAGSDEILIYENEQEKCDQHIQEATLIYTLDFNLLSRTGEMQTSLENAPADFVMIDHHQAPGDYAKYLYSDVNICSTCQMVYHFFEMIEATENITPAIADCLYTGIMTDTGSFKYPSTTSETHRVIADLIDKGANNSLIHQSVYDSSSFNKLQLLGTALNNLQILPEYNTAFITLTQEELDKNNFQKGDTEGFVNYGLSIKGIVFAAIFIENKQEALVKISFRSKGSFDVNQFARKHFDGGGHINAAGARSLANLASTLSEFKALLPKYKNQLDYEV
ncbi:bifunctional oligoribonuclease/PAP phosphatase NrnA [Mesonia sp. K7]|uniref:DHH family phosphoesterase n=1 Tax=Mesonia sp. K7 TaxID=2218606 RepID=UPI000DA7714C|nr:bifunctional oligoribonuclease/PAP phosphatase NrnA [Mesonia sp. K7]PZD79543.1 bifunctional oligoribonuclease/PAP phosphatase NrnA [Mesonia sp. K7]